MANFNKYLIIDTETTNTMEKPLCYNFAGAVIDQHNNIYETGNFINADVFFGKPELMKSAYYACKIPQYFEQITNGDIQIASWYEIKMWVKAMCEKYNIKAIIAHNARFDYRSCTTTQRYETCSAFRYFFPYGVEIWDTLAMSRDVICTMPTYKKFCVENDYICKNGQPRATAEILYRFISKDNDFEEAHKAMEDIEIVMQIFWYCIRQHKKMRRKCWKD